jgi:hypothetical protein
MAQITRPNVAETSVPGQVEYVRELRPFYVRYTDDKGTKQQGIVLYFGLNAKGEPTSSVLVSSEEMDKGLKRPPSHVEAEVMRAVLKSALQAGPSQAKKDLDVQVEDEAENGEPKDA